MTNNIIHKEGTLSQVSDGLTHIQTIIHIADTHIPNANDKRPYGEMIDRFLSTLYKTMEPYDKDTVRIVIAGDVFHNKARISNEATALFHMMMNALNQTAKTYIIAGNHDMLENNHDKMDSLTPTFRIQDVYPNIVYIDKALGYKSGCLVDNNITFALFSMHDKFAVPDIQPYKERYPDNIVIGLYHGDMSGTVTDMGRVSESGIDADLFKECDCVMAGHIHKYQTLERNGIPIVYAGSLFQQDMGENVTNHGFVVWDIKNLSYRLVEVDTPYRYFKIRVGGYDDVNNDTEVAVNL